MARLLITGANGQLGNCFKWVAPHFPEHHFYYASQQEVDITQPDTLHVFYEKNPFDILLNCAAYSNVDLAEKESNKARKINADGVESIALFAEQIPIGVVHFSSDYVFDGMNTEGYSENDLPQPINVYGESKMLGEQVLRQSKCKATTIRISWLFSPFGKNFVKTILQQGKEKKFLKVVDDQIGKPTSGSGLANWVLNAIQRPDFFSHPTYHFAQGPSCSWYTFAQKIIAFAHLPCELHPCKSEEYPTVAKRPKHSVLLTQRTENKIPLPIPSWETDLETCVQILQTNA
jgi:dTDP-4-dehydrorhamnose reductase